ncbi:MAG: galactose mutarotase [Solobacterium sp.]|nr:galactose mutarotase [Solobacterium sp.]
MTVRSFGLNEAGEEFFLYTIENDAVSVSVTDFGAAMVSLVDKQSGIDILLGFENVSDYIKQDAHIGGFIGRTANRTKGAKFTLNGTEYHIEANDGENNLHGGTLGFDRVKYETEITDNAVKFHRISSDGEMGYPGTLDVTVTYTLTEHGVEMKAEGTAVDHDTVFAMTNHNYYNLNGTGDILNHIVTIPADSYAEDASDGVAVLPLKPVEGTVFDFRTPKALGQDINSEEPQIVQNRGFDHHWAVNGKGLRTFAVCEGEKVVLTVESNLPGMHVYTANFLDGPVGKGGITYRPHSSVCFEPEFIPNGINYEGVVKPVVKQGETSVQIIRLSVSSR